MLQELWAADFRSWVSANPEVVAILAEGAIKRANITERSWTGAGSVEAEHCITTKAMAWKVYGVSSGGVYEFPFNLSK